MPEWACRRVVACLPVGLLTMRSVFTELVRSSATSLFVGFIVADMFDCEDSHARISELDTAF